MPTEDGKISLKDLTDIAETKSNISSLRERLQDQENETNRRFMSIGESIDMIRNDIAKIRDNHLFHLENDMSSIKTNVDWLSRFFWIIAGASVGGLVTGIINLL